LYTIAMSSVLRNLAVTDFNSTAFTTAVTTTIAATYSTSGVAVVVEPNGVTAATGSRRLQAAAASSSTSVAYTVQHVTGSTTASGMQALLTSTTGNTALLNSYRANTVPAATAAVSSISTTARSKPQKEPIRSSRKQRSLSDAVIGAITGLTVVVVAVLVWCKRKALISKCSGGKLQQKHLPEQPLPVEPLETVEEPGTRPFQRGATVKESAFPRRQPVSVHNLQFDRSPISTVHLGTTHSTATTPVASSGTRGTRHAVTPVNNANFSSNSVYNSNATGSRQAVTPVNTAGFSSNSVYNSNAAGTRSAYNSSAYSSSAAGTASATSSARTVVAVTGGARSARSTSRIMQSLSTTASSITKSVHSFARSHNGQRAGVVWDGVGESLCVYVQFKCSVCTTSNCLHLH
jgi:hypothetical protein